MKQQGNSMGMTINQSKIQIQTQNHNLEGTQYKQGQLVTKLKNNIIIQIH